NAAWCIERAVRSCQAQTLPASEIIIVDDCSTDETETVGRRLSAQDMRIRYFRKGKNEGHLYALAFGIKQTITAWVALLDADDELTPLSLESRVAAAERYHAMTSKYPQLIYGDEIQRPSGRPVKFWPASGYAYDFVSKELSLCQTSSMMLGREALPLFPVAGGWTTDDRIVLAVSKVFPIMHCGETVAIYHVHNSPTRMSNDARKRFLGVRDLVQDHWIEIIRTHGSGRLLLWYLRILKAYCKYKLEVMNERLGEREGVPVGRWRSLPLRVERRCLWQVQSVLTPFLRRRFELDYF
ncbi:MAG: glycosyltransferase family 2 protein, partial [Xanthobacteraceae bacterium]